MSMFPDWLEIRTQPSSLAPTHMTKPYSQNSDPEDKNNFEKNNIFTIVHELHCQCVQKVVKSKCVLNASHVPEEGLCTQKQPGDKNIGHWYRPQWSYVTLALRRYTLFVSLLSLELSQPFNNFFLSLSLLLWLLQPKQSVRHQSIGMLTCTLG